MDSREKGRFRFGVFFGDAERKQQFKYLVEKDTIPLHA